MSSVRSQRRAFPPRSDAPVYATRVLALPLALARAFPLPPALTLDALTTPQPPVRARTILPAG
eukprot:4069988-Pleurochrysis_carterae.AAC.1